MAVVWHLGVFDESTRQRLACPNAQRGTHTANLGAKYGIFHIRFRCDGKEYKKSLKTHDEGEAECALHGIEQTIPLGQHTAARSSVCETGRFLATSLRCRRSMLSGVTIVVSSINALRPNN
jgi:hypothetical protein